MKSHRRLMLALDDLSHHRRERERSLWRIRYGVQSNIHQPPFRAERRQHLQAVKVAGGAK